MSPTPEQSTADLLRDYEVLSRLAGAAAAELAARGVRIGPDPLPTPPRRSDEGPEGPFVALKVCADATGMRRQRLVRVIQAHNARNPDYPIGWRVGGERGQWEIPIGRFLRIVRGGING